MMVAPRVIYNTFRLLYLAWVIAILAGSSIPGSGIDFISTGDYSFRVDYLLHALAFLPLPVIAWMASGAAVHSVRSPRFRTYTAIAVLLAIASECLQLAVPGRSFNWLDILSNLGGLAAGLAVVWAASGIAARRRLRFPQHY